MGPEGPMCVTSGLWASFTLKIVAKFWKIYSNGTIRLAFYKKKITLVAVAVCPWAKEPWTDELRWRQGLSKNFRAVGNGSSSV